MLPVGLHHWYESAVGDWYGIVDYEIHYIDGRRNTYQLTAPFVPAHALRLRHDPPKA